MIDAILQGAVLGLVLATFCGPIFFMIIDLGLTSSIKSVFYLALSVVLCDVILVFSLIFLAITLKPSPAVLEPIYYLGGGLLLIFGIKNLFAKPTISEEKIEDKNALQKIFVKGFFINAFNPNVFLFWFSAVSLAMNTFHQQKELVTAHFTAGLLVSFTTDFLKGFFAFKLKHLIKPSFINILNKFSGLVLIGFGIKLIFFH
ncbi:MAG: LysE family transporter [Bacteroidota bacterium]